MSLKTRESERGGLSGRLFELKRPGVDPGAKLREAAINGPGGGPATRLGSD